MIRRRRSIRTPVKREAAERYILLSLVSFAASVIVTRTFLQLTGYPQIGGGQLHIAHVLWGGLLLFIAALLPLTLANRWVFNLSAILSGVGVGLFIDEVGKFVTSTNDYFFPPAAPIIYAFFLLTLLFYLTIRRPSGPDPRAMMYRVLEEMTEILDRDLEIRERTSMENRLAEIRATTTDPNIQDLVDALLKYLSDKQLVLACRQPGYFHKLGQKISPVFNKMLTQRRLKTFLILSLGIMGVLALFDFIQLLAYIPAPGPALETMITPLVSKGQLHSAQEAIWYIVRTLLEGVAGITLIVSGGLIAMGRERSGILLGTLTLILWITVINLLVYYFDQFGAVVITLFQFFELTLLTTYRGVYLKLR
jgi:hypothetical protein